MRTFAAVAVAIALVFPMALLAGNPNEQSPKTTAAKHVPITYNIADLPVWRNKGKASSEFAPEILMTYLRATVEPLSWSTGAEMKPIDRTASLVISQTKENHEKISVAIDSFRQDNSREISERIASPPVNVGDFGNPLRPSNSR